MTYTEEDKNNHREPVQDSLFGEVVLAPPYHQQKEPHHDRPDPYAALALPQALDALESVLVLHRQHICGDAWGTQGACFIGHGGCMSGGTCRECRMSYPCPTVAAVTEALS